jgi:hypothetical protein
VNLIQFGGEESRGFTRVVFGWITSVRLRSPEQRHQNVLRKFLIVDVVGAKTLAGSPSTGEIVWILSIELRCNPGIEGKVWHWTDLNGASEISELFVPVRF